MLSSKGCQMCQSAKRDTLEPANTYIYSSLKAPSCWANHSAFSRRPDALLESTGRVRCTDLCHMSLRFNLVRQITTVST
jgi:hypothetical protein